ncbi:MAG: putative oligopeptide transporter, substrate-binding protein, partial [Hyphomicrobiales bacterium]|nr:putative oligopeptide transporter, substrate-binding protein [Hyphomicrobiales bacterium]
GGTDRGYGWLNRILGYEPLVRFAPEGGKVVPNIAESWTANDNSTEFTFKLRKGMKWSDGAPVTADDIMFWYQDMALNPELFPGGPGGAMVVSGKPATLSKIDDLTVKFTFAAPFGLFLQQLASGNNQPPIAPKHYAQQFLPKYNKDGVPALMKKEGVSSWVDLVTHKVGGPVGTNFAQWLNPDLPTLNAWTVTKPYDGSSSQVVATRNPYYWKVDTAGNQLPYLDSVAFPIVGDPEVLKLMVMNGQIDFVYRPQNFTISDKPTFFDNQAAGKYHFIDLSPDVGAAHAMHLNLTVQDPVKRALFDDKNFRIALSYAINRPELIDIIYVGQGEPFQVAPRPESEFYDEAFAKQYTEFKPDEANKMLDGLGLTQRGGDGIRLMSNGQPLSIKMDVRTDTTQQIDSLQLIKGYWKNVGVDLQVNVIDSALYRERQVSNLYEASSNVGAGGLNELLNPRLYVPINDNALYAVPWSYWYNKDKRGIEPDEATKKQLAIYTQALATADQAKQAELFKQVLAIAKDEFRSFGVSLLTGSYAIASNRMGNVPAKMIDSAIYPTPAPLNLSTWYIKAQ